MEKNKDEQITQRVADMIVFVVGETMKAEHAAEMERKSYETRVRAVLHAEQRCHCGVTRR